ncbi:c-type cytochrome [Altererythrobacter xixiisoli]|uniref:C-type cytochrome n=2 Tax=Croceibacterium xixiisoli TaxID=1476466 RepID=A0A6I4TVH8_9SPHN|nr:c-type cytochrome [Croceibacterium xixiisoli]MXO98323.1 c-type cytochrome [Croceibacterium xixiisoli]
MGVLTACKPPAQTRQHDDAAAQKRGLKLMETKGCGACHEIPGLNWPRGQLGPSLMRFNDTGLIAGYLPNTPVNLAAFIRNAPATKPGSTMPAMPVTVSEAVDMAAYLQGGGRD